MDFAEQFAATNLKTEFIAISPFLSRDHRLICSQEEEKGRGGGREELPDLVKGVSKVS